MSVMGGSVYFLRIRGLLLIMGRGHIFSIWVRAEVVSVSVIIRLLVLGGQGKSGSYLSKANVIIKYIYLQIIIGACLLFSLV